MADYIVLIQDNAKSRPSAEEWDQFFTTAGRSGLFEGGSAMGNRVVLGDSQSAKSTEHVVGFMRFRSEDKQQLLDLLQGHPIVLHGGSVELCEMSET